MRAHRWRVYVNPLNDFGTAYTGFVEVSDDVEMGSLGSIDQSLDNTDYNIGIFRNSSLPITFRNDSGKYSDVDAPRSMFKFTRANSLVKITYAGSDSPLVAGFFQSSGPQVIVAPEIDIFTGILSDRDVKLDTSNQELTFNVLGLESILQTSPTPIAAISFPSAGIIDITTASPGVIHINPIGILNIGSAIQFNTTGTLPIELVPGQTYYVSTFISPVRFTVASSYADALAGVSINFSTVPTGFFNYVVMFNRLASDIIFRILSQSKITAVLNIDITRIVPANDIAFNDTSDLVALNAWDSIQDILIATNSVMYVEQSTQTIVVAPRTVAPVLAYTFYGQSATSGVENIKNIQNIQAGLSRVFNSFLWSPQNTTIEDAPSIAKFGLNRKEFKYKFFYDAINQASIMQALLSEFSQPRQEMDIYTPINYTTLSLFLLNRVNIDYPPIAIPGPAPFPICGQAICGVGVLPNAIFGFMEITSNFYKIEGTSIDPQTDLICFSIRRV